MRCDALRVDDHWKQIHAVGKPDTRWIYTLPDGVGSGAPWVCPSIYQTTEVGALRYRKGVLLNGDAIVITIRLVTVFIYYKTWLYCQIPYCTGHTAR